MPVSDTEDNAQKGSASFENELSVLKHNLELCKKTAFTDDLKQLFQDELTLLLKAEKEKNFNVEYVEGCSYRMERTMGVMSSDFTQNLAR